MKIIRVKTFSLYAVNKDNEEYTFILSVNARTLKEARQYAQSQVLKLNAQYPKYQFDFRWEEDNV